MQGIETVLMRVASTVTGTLLKSLLAKRPGAGLTRSPVRPAPPGRTPSRLGEGEVRRLTEALAERLRGVCDTGPYAGLPGHERLAAAAAVRDTFAAAGPLDLPALLEVDLDEAALAARLLERNGAGRAGLSTAAAALHRELVGLSCRHVVEYVTALPSFGPRTDVELIRRTGKAERALTALRARIGPSPGATALAFEERYAAYIAEAHCRMGLFGLTTGRRRHEWSLDTAYVSLAVSSDAGVRAQQQGTGVPRTARSAVTAERAFADSDRLLLSGPAGAGKSTLVQWLALNAARRSFTGRLAAWNSCVPFVLRLRSVGGAAAGRADASGAAAPLPLPAQFLAAAGVPLTGSAPSGWAESLLAEGRALVVVDGVDELPPRLRRRTADWLRTLITAFPKARYVVTTRAGAVPRRWLAGLGFVAHDLLPMDRDAIRAFIAHWHAAAREDTRDEAERRRLDTYEKSLKRAVATRRDLARLATNPLMCALLCALHRDRRMHLPRARKELYDAALDMLLIRRDAEREISGVEGVDLTRDEQTLLLQRLAYWLIRNGQSEAASGDAIEMIDRWLAAMPQVRAQGDAHQVFSHLLIRSGLLREPVPGTVDFVHRTFQDYLGAKAAVESRDFGLLVARAHDDRWEDVLRMAVGHARPEERAVLLRRLLHRADAARRHRHHLVLLTAACLEHAPELDPEIRSEVERRTARLVPPQSAAEARELAKAGQLVLELLPGPDGLDEESAAATVHTAALLGGPAALEVIARFRDDPRFLVCHERAGHWGSFPDAEYADAVLASGLGEAYLQVRTREQLRLLPRLPRITAYDLAGDLDLAAGIGHLRQAESLYLQGDGLSPDLAPLRELPGLRLLGLDSLPGLDDLEPLADTAVRTLYLFRLRPGPPLEPLARMRSLTHVNIDYPVHGGSLDALPLDPRLTGLGLFDAARDMPLYGIDRWPRLAWLTLTGPAQGGSLHLLAGLSRLRTLQLVQQPELDLRALEPLRSLEELWLSDCAADGSLGALRALPRLTSLHLTRCGSKAHPLNIAPLAALSGLTVTVEEGTRIRGAERFADGRLVVTRRVRNVMQRP